MVSGGMLVIVVGVEACQGVLDDFDGQLAAIFRQTAKSLDDTPLSGLRRIADPLAL